MPVSYADVVRKQDATSISLNPLQWSVSIRKVPSFQYLNTGFMIAIEWRHCVRTPGIDRIPWVGEPQPEVGCLDGGGTRVQDEGFITEDPSHVDDSVATSIGCYVSLIPRRDEGSVWCGNYKQGEVGVCRKREQAKMRTNSLVIRSVRAL